MKKLSDEQKIFNKVSRHLLKQGKKSVEKSEDEGLVCVYRGPEGEKCAVGCLINDEYYSKVLENKTVFDPKVQEVLEKSGVELNVVKDEYGTQKGNPIFNMLSSLQNIHDSEKPSRWAQKLRQFGRIKGLDISHLEGK